MVLDQSIPDWLIKIIFLGKVETAIKSGIKSRFGIMSSSPHDAIWGPLVFSLTVSNFSNSLYLKAYLRRNSFLLRTAFGPLNYCGNQTSL